MYVCMCRSMSESSPLPSPPERVIVRETKRVQQPPPPSSPSPRKSLSRVGAPGTLIYTLPGGKSSGSVEPGFAQWMNELARQVQTETSTKLIERTGSETPSDIHFRIGMSTTGRAEGDAEMKLFERDGKGSLLNVLLWFRKNNDNVKLFPWHPGNEPSGLLLYRDLEKRVSPQYVVVSLEYHVEKGIWPASENPNNRLAINILVGRISSVVA